MIKVVPILIIGKVFISLCGAWSMVLACLDNVSHPASVHALYIGSNAARKLKSFREWHRLKTQLYATCYTTKQDSHWSQHLSELLNNVVTIALCSCKYTAFLLFAPRLSQTRWAWNNCHYDGMSRQTKLQAVLSNLCCYQWLACISVSLFPFIWQQFLIIYQNLQKTETRKKNQPPQNNNNKK